MSCKSVCTRESVESLSILGESASECVRRSGALELGHPSQRSARVGAPVAAERWETWQSVGADLLHICKSGSASYFMQVTWSLFHLLLLGKMQGGFTEVQIDLPKVHAP